MTGRVWQLVPVLEPGDAVGNHAQAIARVLGARHGGFIVERADPSLQHLAVRFTEASVDPGDVLVYHAALSSQLAGWMRGAPGRKVVDYHNVTPPEFFRAYDPGLWTALANARGELERLRGEVALAVGHSEFSRRELEAMGFRRTETVPVLLDFARRGGPGNEQLRDELERGKRERTDVLFVGRLAPNKRQEDVVKAFAVYRRLFNPSARLFLVGGSNASSYRDALRAFVERLGIEEVHLVGRVGDGDLAAYYRAADVFVSMSEHEGFGAPLLEAMHYGVPVVAFAAAAVPETVGAGGILFRRKRYEEVAALIDLVVRDEDVRGWLVEAGRARLEAFRPEVHEARFLRLIEELPA